VPERIQLRRTKGWRKPLDAVVVSRPSKWGNPFAVGEEIGRDSPLWPYLAQAVPGGTGGLASVKPLTREIVVDAYGWWLIEQPHLMLSLKSELAGRDLACWCPLPEPGQDDVCHAATLLAIANDQEQEYTRG
jgi:Domain of unknown function (DUF4326)